MITISVLITMDISINGNHICTYDMVTSGNYFCSYEILSISVKIYVDLRLSRVLLIVVDYAPFS